MSENTADIKSQSSYKPGDKFAKLKREYLPEKKKAGDILKAELSEDSVKFKRLRKNLAKEFVKNKRVSDIDEVTQLPVRRVFEERLREEVDRAQRHNHKITMVMLDLNRLKEINNESHTAGDEALKTTASNLSNSLRIIDIISRYGGDEFAVIFPETSLAEIGNWWERFKENMDKTKYTVSAGAAEIDLTNIDYLNVSKPIEEMRSKADLAMAQAKEEGKHSINILKAA